jgi:hypothetical protein
MFMALHSDDRRKPVLIAIALLGLLLGAGAALGVS